MATGSKATRFEVEEEASYAPEITGTGTSGTTVAFFFGASQ